MLSEKKIVAPTLKWALVIATVLPSLSLAAQESRDTTEKKDSVDRTGISPVVVVGNRKDARLSTGSAFVIEPSEIARFRSSNIGSILRAAPGVYVREEDGLGTFPRIGIRASASGRSDRISVLEDGIPAAMAPYANTSAYYFPTAGRMHAVEVLKGPEILRYGPQTTSGAVNLLSTPIPDSPSGFVSVEGGAWNSLKIHSWAGATLGQFGVLAEVYQNKTDGFQRIDRSSRTAGNDISDYMLKLRWKSSLTAPFIQQADVKLFSGENIADVSYLGLTDADFRTNPDRRYGLSELERMTGERKSASVQHRLFTPFGLSLTTTGYYTKTSRDYTRLNQVNGISIGGSGITSQINRRTANADFLQAILDGRENTTHQNGVRYGNNFQTYISKGIQLESRLALATGGVSHEFMAGVRHHDDESRNTATSTNLVYNQINGSLVYNGRSQATPSSGFARATSFWIADRINIGELAILPLIRHESIESRANVDLSTSARNELSKTTFGLGVNYSIDDHWTLLAGAHQGFAPPGSGAVEGSRGEESLNMEGGLRFYERFFSIDIVGFYSDYNNALRNCRVSNPCADGATDGVQQDGAKKVQGVEIGVDANLLEKTNYKIPLRFAYTYTGGEYTKAADNESGVRKGDVLDYTPKHIGRLILGIEHSRGVDLDIGLNFSDGACINTTCGRDGVDSRFLKTESVATVDLASSYTLTPTTEFYIRAENIMDQRRITHRGSDGARGNPGRYFGAGIRVGF